MRSGRPLRARGATLLAMVAIIALGGSWFLVRELNAGSSGAAAGRIASNGEVLNRAKQALIGYVAQRAATAGENNPGRLPCPESANHIGTSSEGIAGPSIGPTVACTQIGRLPWRTIGVDKLVDSASEPLWYVVGPAWRLTNSSDTLLINSNTTGDIAVDGQQVVALIIAPGRAMNAQAVTGCTARNQVRTTPSPTIDYRDYIECFTGVSQFITTASSTSYNDQVVRVTVADVMPAIEAAVAKRIEREIVPQLQNVYAGTAWGLAAGLRLYPFAAPFADPGPGAGTSDFKGVDGIYQGLLPFNQVDCTADAANPRCLPGVALISWATFSPGPEAYDAGGWGNIDSWSCWWETGNAARVCEGQYSEYSLEPWRPGMRIAMQVRLNNVAMGLRRFDTTRMQIDARDNGTTTWLAQTVNHAKTINSDGSLTITFWADLPNIDSMGWGSYAEYRIRIERLVVRDHALLDPNDAVTGWFARNEWYRLLYYAAAQMSTADGALPNVGCASGSNCLRLTVWPSTALEWDKRALLVLAGRSLATPPATRPNSVLTDYLEFGNNDGGTRYEQRTIGRTMQFNDRVIVVDTN